MTSARIAAALEELGTQLHERDSAPTATSARPRAPPPARSGTTRTRWPNWRERLITPPRSGSARRTEDEDPPPPRNRRHPLGGETAGEAAKRPPGGTQPPFSPRTLPGASSGSPTSRGDLHSHTTLSDGRNTIDGKWPRRRGRAATVSGDYRPLGQPRLRRDNHRQATLGSGSRRDAEEWNGSKRAFGCSRSSESTSPSRRLTRLLRDLLAALELGDRQRPHLVRDLRGARMTARIVAAIETRPIASEHLTGRLIGRREPTRSTSAAVVAAAAAERHDAAESGRNSDREAGATSREEHARLAADAGVKIVLNTDAHGIETPRQHELRGDRRPRCRAHPDQVANTRNWRDFSRLI